jgi:hypothetical protein
MSTLATQIRNAAFDRLKGFGEFKSRRKSPVETLQPADLPALGVFLSRETMNADGDYNVGEPRFIVDALISISVVDLATGGNVLDGRIDEWVDRIEDTLLCDPTFVRLNDDKGMPLIEGFSQIARSYSFPKNGDSYLMEVRLQLTVRFRCHFAPQTQNTLQIVAVIAQPFGEAGTTFENQFETGGS